MDGGTTTSWAALAADLRDRPPRAGSTRVVLVDGRSGSGKTTLADRLAPHLGSQVVRLETVHLEDHVHGWTGLEDAVQALSDDVLVPLAAGRPGHLQRYDWAAGEPGEVTVVPPAPVVLVEGNGVLAVPARHLVAATVWLEVPAEVREERLDAREDAELYRPYRETWAAQEDRLAARSRPLRTADLVVREAGERGVVVAPR